MNRAPIALTALLMTACPIEAAGPPKDSTDEPAQGESGPGPDPATASASTTATGDGDGDDEAASTETGSEATCEEKLAKVEAQLEACQAGK